jgi:hypothetical protein
MREKVFFEYKETEAIYFTALEILANCELFILERYGHNISNLFSNLAYAQHKIK